MDQEAGLPQTLPMVLILDLPVSRTTRNRSPFFCHSVCGILLEQPEQTQIPS